MPPMPPRVAAIKRAIETKQDFTALANGGEAAVFEYARSIGMRGGALVLEWQESYRQRQRDAGTAGGRGHKKNPTRNSEQGFDDLDRWADDVEPDDGDDDDLAPEPTTKLCPDCQGAGRVGGARCARCNGTGRIDADDVDDDQEEDDDVEPKEPEDE